MAKPELMDVLEGYSGAIFACAAPLLRATRSRPLRPLTRGRRRARRYGQTGSGKTHSLMNGGEKGDLADAGLFPRLAVDLFTAISADAAAHVYNVEVAFCQIYNEQARDARGKA